MADQDHSEGIRLQAERVVTAYNALRDNANTADFKSDDFPVGLFAELVSQIKRLQGWLDAAPRSEPIPANRRAVGTDWDAMTLELGRVTSLVDLVDRLLCENVDCSKDSDASVLVTPVDLLRMEVEYLNTAIERLYPNWHEPEKKEPKDLHEQIVEEIREEYPDADGHELLLRVAIREHVACCMSPHEEDETYQRISKVVKLVDADAP